MMKRQQKTVSCMSALPKWQHNYFKQKTLGINFQGFFCASEGYANPQKQSKSFIRKARPLRALLLGVFRPLLFESFPSEDRRPYTIQPAGFFPLPIVKPFDH